MRSHGRWRMRVCRLAARPCAGLNLIATRCSWMRLAVVLCAFSILVTVSPITARAVDLPPRFGARYLTAPCCNGDQLNGTRAAIRVQNPSPNATGCVVASSYAQADPGTGNNLIQAGVLKCGLNAGIDGTCSQMNNLVKFVETRISGSYACHQHGAASTGVQYTATVDQGQPGSNEWFSFIEGSPYEHHPGFAQWYIQEAAEHTGSDSCSGWAAAFTFGEETQRWQRFIRSSLSWFTVQSSFLSPGCWSMAGAPPSWFSFTH